MTIRKTAYETAACNGFLIHKTLDALHTARYNGWVTNIADVKFQIGEVRGGSSFADAVPAFAHPILLEEKSGDLSTGPMVVYDVRSFGGYQQGEFKIRNEIEYKLLQHRAKLNAIWVNENPVILRDLSPLPMAIYASWISENIARRFALDPREQLDLGILAAVFYNSLFTDKRWDEHEEHDRMRLVSAISRSLRVQATDVLPTLDKITKLDNLNDFCEAAQEVTGSIRLKDLNVGTLFAVVAGTWFGGTNAKEMVTVALEHPPTWMAILFAAYNERSFKNSGITKLTERNSNRDAGRDYTKVLVRFVGHFE